jgi:flagellar basal body-associated protein FliL
LDITSQSQSFVVVIIVIVTVIIIAAAVVAAVFFFWVAFSKLHVLVNSTQRKITEQVNQDLTLFHTDILTFLLKRCCKCLIPLMEKYNFTLPAFLIHFL